MNKSNDGMFIRSNSSRDLLQNAALFKTDKLVVWEYVSNGLEYVDAGTNPVVKVTLDGKRRRIAIADNGRGMDWSALNDSFFMMHGENVDRRMGRPGRGRFGTGKSAALGIADVLRVTTVRQGKRSTVQITRQEVESIEGAGPVPVKIIEQETPVTLANGTMIEIEQVHLRGLDQPGVIRYIERHLAKWPRSARVFVNNHECEYVEPPVARTRVFVPETQSEKVLGDVELTVKVSKTPLDAETRGIAIYSNGVWHETTLAGNEGRDLSQYLFGEVDIPSLDSDRSAIGPFDLSRSMRLNPSNDLVQAAYAFVGRCLDLVRRELLEEDKIRRASDEERRMQEQASEIAKLLNDDFTEFSSRILRVKAAGSAGMDLGDQPSGGGNLDDLLVIGQDVPANLVAETGGPGAIGEGRSGGHEARSLAPQLRQGEGGSTGKTTGGEGKQRRSRGGFTVKFKRMGEDSHRAHYSSEDRVIYINLDHPQLAAALETVESVTDAVFRRLAYEVAFTEYSIALAQELAARDEYVDPSDPIFDIRETLNRLSRKAANVYRE